jgi:hypothetical protein
MIILIYFIFYKHKCTEKFMNACQYYHVPGIKYGEQQNLKQQIGRPGIEVEKEKLYPTQYRANWVRHPEPRFKYECHVDDKLNRKCKWTPIYTKFYPDLRGEQENMIAP